MARDLNFLARMRVLDRPLIVQPPREADLDERAAHHVDRVPHACQACGELTTRGVLCSTCQERARPHETDDPYDVLGEDQGAE